MTKDKELMEAIKLGVKTLILKEVRLLRFEQGLMPNLVTKEMSRSIEETKRTVIQLTRAMDQKKRTTLLKKIIRQALDEEIDRAVQLRKTKCIRCLHGRFYDEEGTAYFELPLGGHQAKTIGCDQLRPDLREKCKRFVEISIGSSLKSHLYEVTLLYEFREMMDRVEEIWKDYLTQ